MKCPNCQTRIESDGAYCPRCGTPLDAACDACEAPLPTGARYCTQCGEPVREASNALPWYIAGGAIAALIIALLVPVLGSSEPEPMGAPGPVTAQSAPAAGGGSMNGRPPPLTGTPREQADRLFNRVMQARSEGDSQQASSFLPMAMAAYERVPDLDTDGLYHLSVLRLTAGDSDAARSTAERVLDRSENHLLALAVAAQSAKAGGDRAAARRYYRRLLEHYDEERTRDLREYRDHAAILPMYRDSAEIFLGR